MDVLEKIISKQKEIEKAHADDFRALAYAIASGLVTCSRLASALK
jgi:hypothetical protein